MDAPRLPAPLRVIHLPVHTISEANARPSSFRELRGKRGRSTRNRGLAANMLSVALRAAPSLLPLRHPLVILMVRSSPQRLDRDNLGGALKAVQDGIADALDMDDGDPRLTFVTDQARGEHGVRVELYERAAVEQQGREAIALLPTGALARVDARLRALEAALAPCPSSTRVSVCQQFGELRELLRELGLH